MQDKTVDAADQQPANKYRRFELESEDFGNPQALPTVQAIQVLKFMATHIAQGVKEKILYLNPMPIDIKTK